MQLWALGLGNAIAVALIQPLFGHCVFRKGVVISSLAFFDRH